MSISIADTTDRRRFTADSDAGGPRAGSIYTLRSGCGRGFAGPMPRRVRSRPARVGSMVWVMGRLKRVVLVWTLLCVAAILTPQGIRPVAAQALPDRLSDREFWEIVSRSSEPDGFFQSDNLVSNELSYQEILPELLKGSARGGVYLGVGPDQNFTYIAALRPRMAFIVDIRRVAMMQHLMYKALFEMAPARADFLALLLSRPRPSSVGPTSTPQQLVSAFSTVAPDTTLYWQTLDALHDRLTRRHGFELDADDLAAIDYVYTSFHVGGLDVTYNFGGMGRGGRGMPSLGDLITATDAQGINHGFLASERAYLTVRRMQLRNLIIPVVGDFAGPKALREVGRYLSFHHAGVSTIYTSNVEQYLFRDADRWRDYYDNVASLPLDSRAMFVRSIFSFNVGQGRAPSRRARSVTLLQPVSDLLRAVRDGRVTRYEDVTAMSRTVWQDGVRP